MERQSPIWIGEVPDVEDENRVDDTVRFFAPYLGRALMSPA
jgi:hypothetical protein